MKITWELHRVLVILSHFTRSAAENREMRVGGTPDYPLELFCTGEGRVLSAVL